MGKTVELVAKMLSGSELALARLITQVECDASTSAQIMKLVYSRTGRAYSIGVTGPPGSGKSTLVDKLTAIFRGKGLSVGIVAVDPTSPFSGGAVLGDRIRMQQHCLDSGVFIRSMATRGSLGGLPQAARSVMRLLDAFGKDIILVETVGVGQSELDVMKATDATVVVLCPEAGDAIQTMKAGIMEIADIFVVNKADRDGADQLVRGLESMLMMIPKRSYWEVPVLSTQAVRDVGVEELYGMILKHRDALQSSGQLELRRQEQRKDELLQTIQQEFNKRLLRLMERDGRLESFSRRVTSGELDPYSAAGVFLSDGAVIKKWIAEMEGPSQ